MANNQYNFLDYAGLSLFWNNVKSIIEENELATASALTNLDTRVDNLEASKADKDGTGATGTWGINITGNAGASNRTKFLETFQQNSTTNTYGSQYPIWAQWSDDSNVRLKCTNYTVWTDKANYAINADSATNAGYATNAGNADKLGNIAAGNYFKNGDAALNTEWSRKYLWTLWDNHLYAADKHLAVTLTGVNPGYIPMLFDGCFESYTSITEPQAVLNIRSTTEGNVWTAGLPYGYFYVVFYASDAENVTGRVYCEYEPQGIGWHDLAVEHVGPNIWRLHNGYYQLSDLEITITKPASSAEIYLCQVLHMVYRSPGPYYAAVMSKYCDQKTNYSIEAANFIKTGGTSAQFLKADGSLDSNAYLTGITKQMVTDALGYTPPTTNTTYNFSGTSFTSGDSGAGEHDANNITTNGLWYYTTNGPATSLGASTADGALYSQAYSTSWVGQIAQDYRNGNLFTRGRNNDTWSNWKAVSYDGHTHTGSEVKLTG